MARIGVRDVAREAGVSPMSASRALRGIDGVSEGTRRRVEAVAARLGYVPDANARALRGASSRLIGISVPNLFNDVFADVIDGMRRTLRQAGYSSVLDTTDYDPAEELAWCRRMAPWRPAALVLTGASHDPALAPMLRATALPVVEIWDAGEAPIDLCVGVDHEAAGAMLGAHVAGLGYRRPAYVGKPPGRDPRADARFRGAARAFAAVGAPVARVACEAADAFAEGVAGVGRIDWSAPPDVLLFHNDNTAFGGLQALAARGLDVPGDVGVAGFNRLPIGAVLPRPLTTLETPRRQIGLEAARLLLARLAGVAPPRRTVLPCRLVEGATTRAVG